jgi:hypothetical protein
MTSTRTRNREVATLIDRILAADEGEREEIIAQLKGMEGGNTEPETKATKKSKTAKATKVNTKGTTMTKNTKATAKKSKAAKVTEPTGTLRANSSPEKVDEFVITNREPLKITSAEIRGNWRWLDTGLHSGEFEAVAHEFLRKAGFRRQKPERAGNPGTYYRKMDGDNPKDYREVLI